MADQLGLSPQSIPEVYACPTTLTLSSMEHRTCSELKTAQDEDPIIGEVKREVELGKIVTYSKSSNDSVAL